MRRSTVLNQTITHGHPRRLGAVPWVVFGLLLGACGEQSAAPPAAPKSDRLPRVPVASDSVTVSGISAGGYMAVQFHVAHSALVHGAGVIAAGPYYCAENSMRHALGRCMQGDSEIPVDQLIGATSQLALDEAIDPIAGLADDRVWIFHGSADPVVAKPVVDALRAYYSALVNPAHIAAIEGEGAAHVFPTRDKTAAPCDQTASPFIGNCDIDGARLLLEHLYGGPFAAPTPAAPAGELREFDQRPYGKAAKSAGLADKGFLYVPAACREGTSNAGCRLHVVFHGCKQGASYVEDNFVRRAGYLAAADAGRIVVLFPQVAPSFQPLNPNGCWDWWGYEGQWYATKAGPQIAAVRRMVADLMGDAPASAAGRNR
jgi:poly(3-hydroxybutyrate) depolymerase